MLNNISSRYSLYMFYMLCFKSHWGPDTFMKLRWSWTKGCTFLPGLLTNVDGYIYVWVLFNGWSPHRVLLTAFNWLLINTTINSWERLTQKCERQPTLARNVQLSEKSEWILQRWQSCKCFIVAAICLWSFSSCFCPWMSVKELHGVMSPTSLTVPVFVIFSMYVRKNTYMACTAKPSHVQTHRKTKNTHLFLWL